MAIELENSFAVPVPPEQAWDVLLDVARVAPCMPGATVDEVDGDVVTGRIKVKVGPIALTYTGKATFTERDPVAHAVTVEAAGKETRGAGTASATVHATLEADGGNTRVLVHTSLNVTGRPAQFGRGVMAEVGGRLIETFSANLAKLLASDSGPPAAAKTVDGRLSIPIQELNLPARSAGILKDEGIDTVGALVSRTQSDLLAIKNIGEKSVEEIEDRLQDLGLALAGRDTAAANGAPDTSLDGDDLQATGQGVDGGPRPAAGLPREDTDEEDEQDALNLLDVAAGPILKRVLPAVGAAVVLLWAGFRLRRRGRRAES
jgi:uncharacterized protein